MTMKGMLDKIFACYGCDITLERSDGSTVFQGFFQPHLSRAWQESKSRMDVLGLETPGQYLLLCPPEPEMLPGDTVITNGTAYLLRRRETVRYGSEPIYQWCLCTRKGDSDPWPTPS